MRSPVYPTNSKLTNKPSSACPGSWIASQIESCPKHLDICSEIRDCYTHDEL